MKYPIEFKGKEINKYPIIIIAYLLAIVVLLGLLYAFPSASGALSSDETLEYGSIEITDDVTCYFIRNENVYFSNAKGTVGYYVQEGDSVRKGKQVIEMKPDPSVETSDTTSRFKETASKYLSGENLFVEDQNAINACITSLNAELSDTSDESRQYEIKKHISQLNSALTSLSKTDQEAVNNTPAYQMGIVPENYQTSFRGSVSYYLDGYEYALNPDTMTLLDQNKMEKLDFISINVCKGTANSGDPLFKVIKNDEWYAIAWIDPSDIGKYSEGKTVKLQLPLGEAAGKVSSITEKSGQVMVAMRFNTYYPEFGKLRKSNCKVITSDSEGLLVSNDCIVSSGGAIGVYVRNVTDGYDFTPIKVKASDGSYSILVAGYYYESIGETQSVKVSTVDVYDEVKRNVSK